MKAEIQFGKIRKVRGENIRVNGLIVCPTLRIGIVMYYVSEMPVSICMYRDRYIKFAGGFYVAFKNSICHHHHSVLPKGRFFTASAGT